MRFKRQAVKAPPRVSRRRGSSGRLHAFMGALLEVELLRKLSQPPRPSPGPANVGSHVDQTGRAGQRASFHVFRLLHLEDDLEFHGHIRRQRVDSNRATSVHAGVARQRLHQVRCTSTTLDCFWSPSMQLTKPVTLMTWRMRSIPPAQPAQARQFSAASRADR